MNATTRTLFAIQSTPEMHRGGGWFYRKPTGARSRNREWVMLEHATTWDNYAAALKCQHAVDIGHGMKCTRIVELEMNLRVRGKNEGGQHGNA